MEFSRLPVMLLLVSLIPVSHLQVWRKAVVSITPDTHVFIGESVTLRCIIQGREDTQTSYYWYKNNKILKKNETSFIILSAGNTDSGDYTCQRRQSEMSAAVTLTVSETPRPVLSVSPHSWLTEGDSVTLICEVTDSSTDWTFSWYREGLYRHGVTQIKHSDVSTMYVELVSDSSRGSGGSYTLSSAALNHTGVYVCRGKRGEPVFHTQYSNLQQLWITAKPKPTVRVNPQSSIYTGDTVTLTCELQESTGWEFLWYKYDEQLQDFNTNTLSVNNTGDTVYKCRARRDKAWARTEYYTEYSNEVMITATERPQAVLSVSPKSWLTEGDSVTLNCEVTNSTDWTFSWYTVVLYRDDITQIKTNHGSTMYVELLSDSSRGSGGSYTLSPASLKHTGVYVCRGERGEPALHTQYSNLQPLWITGESPPVSLIINPNRTQHFTNDSLSLSCEDQSHSTGWTVRRYTHSEGVLDCSQWGSVTGSTCNISSLYTSHTGVYWCESESGENSNPVNITVHGSKPMARSVPVGLSVGLSLFFILIVFLILMILLWHYKIKKEMQQKLNQTSEENQRQSGAEDSQSGHTPLQAGTENIYASVDQADMSGTGEAAAESSEAIYAIVTKKKKKNRNDGVDADNICDVMYAELEVKPMKKAKRIKENVSVGDENVYSEPQPK
ncbi:Fc receptor-like protein 5 isoform X1, partial [Clarias magur]